MAQQVPTDQWLSRAELAELLKVHTETLRRWERQGIGPRPTRLSPAVLRYRHDDVRTWLEEAGRRPVPWRGNVPAGSSVRPACGECEARPDDPPSARWRVDDTGRWVKCPDCHPGAVEAAS